MLDNTNQLILRQWKVDIFLKTFKTLKILSRSMDSLGGLMYIMKVFH